ncbi:MAG: hypothetical protein JW836_04085 [Deltaproteobacteria bacterium]|nr:hypothetical protein [Deltaproteobacteria bacterium]
MDDSFVKAYHDFRNSVDLSKSGVLPDIDNLVCYLLMGVPRVPADVDTAYNAAFLAVDQRVTILKAVFIEVNRQESETFLDEGLVRYNLAGEKAKSLLQETEEIAV